MGKTLVPLSERRASRVGGSVNSQSANSPSHTSIGSSTTTQPSHIPSHAANRILRDRNPSLTHKIDQMRLTLAPIYPIHIPAGPPHESYPRSVLHYWLLTEDEIDAFARYYHQVEHTEYTSLYPACMGWDKGFLSRGQDIDRSNSVSGVSSGTGENIAFNDDGLMIGLGLGAVEDHYAEARRRRGELSAVERLAIKRRMVGKFIGLRGCETPMWEMRAKVRWLDGRVRREIEDERERESTFRRGRKWI
ncbi:hypothetical protein EJ05DRAFT_147525 [Pseudovirgaria hyperparasitica]|uniref:Uncharacterized protein n=1 Tax=Pseudovirgaria hyperparasitica TaxID=470096 RepID=A0A6A6VTQ2_9PEZI|nr:uncharacterized protein EJ05DRAFT_147525 [Pseudovirgaria hyperparasitica]KAF2754068.1 hypothetical protein EJ05DRAFT_147525 [Pseudovirgaria hyperparasitica]